MNGKFYKATKSGKTVEVNTIEYQRQNGTAPRGSGSYAFRFNYGIVRNFTAPSYAEARKEAIDYAFECRHYFDFSNTAVIELLA
jgi:hypothetical protein